MSGRGNEVYAAVDSGVRNPFLPVDVDLLLQVRLVLVIDELHDGLPAGPREGRVNGSDEGGDGRIDGGEDTNVR